MSITLHHVPFSRSFRVLWLLEELGLSAQIVMHSIRAGTMRQPDMRALSPAGRVPALEIDGMCLFESGAIVEYLAETHPEAGLAALPGTPDRARYLQMVHFAETQASLLEQLNMSHVFLRDPAQASPTVIKLTTMRLHATLGALESLLGDQEFLLAQGFSAADIMMGFNLFAAPYYVDLAEFPKLCAYRDRIAARPAYVAARAKDGEQEFYTQDFYPVPEGA
ncbi:glutathione S-transferase family protein [Shimia marina]|uniref:Glutathione S-transferase GST-6.0 n=1 Tax=Shimia marina TaxID=321267 RepID=A0A0P1EJG5_9RHOB|nr:glutathione S-transferase family protein [Shimia marina]CUH50669.1 Glutathione S-transferase GST-6.0 [Shimia marina]SFE37264.1 glutathione S-transferase [Shimia marina]